ncbi:methyltransferase [marine bacterium AO1-C]|nr:methyltransferase [marine bacterium AO1-C]
MWDERYQKQGFAYGKAPNVFFKEWLSKFNPGSLLMPADGEGRNGVFAAELGWQVTAFDLSKEGKTKALQLAAEQGVKLDYLVGDFAELEFAPASFDAIGLIYAHFAPEKKAAFHQRLSECLKPGGIIILEAFGKNHLEYRQQNPKVGGPGIAEMLYSEEEIRADFKDYEMIKLTEEEVTLNEGRHHNGKGSVVRFVGRKPVN